MSLFHQIHNIADQVDITLRIFKKGDKLTIEVTPHTNTPVRHIAMTGTPEELSDGFLEQVRATASPSTGLIVQELPGEEPAKKTEPKTEKPAPATGKKVKEAKAKASKAEKKSKKVAPKAQEQSMFGAPQPKEEQATEDETGEDETPASTEEPDQEETEEQ